MSQTTTAVIKALDVPIITKRTICLKSFISPSCESCSFESQIYSFLFYLFHKPVRITQLKFPRPIKRVGNFSKKIGLVCCISLQVLN